jgi:hypothetical protein
MLIRLSDRACPVPLFMLPIDAVLGQLRWRHGHRPSSWANRRRQDKTRSLALMDESWLKGRNILVLQPRRITSAIGPNRRFSQLKKLFGYRRDTGLA